MRKVVFAVMVLFIALLVGCSTPAPKFDKWTPDQVVNTFKAVGLECENVRSMTKDDYGPAPMKAAQAMRFYVPSLGENVGGRIFSFSDQTELDDTKRYYDELGKESAWFFSWTFARDNILVQINGDLKEDKARQYEEALNSLK